MKTYKLVLIILTILIIGLMTSSCTRTAVDDPDMTGYAGFEVIMSGNADPSMLIISQGIGDETSLITVKASRNDGTPVVDHRVLFKINDEFGRFLTDKQKQMATKRTNGQGIARITYLVDRQDRKKIGAEYTTYIQAILQDDNRLDNPLSEIYDLIPIKLVTDVVDVEKDTFSRIIVSGDPSSIDSTTGGSFSVYLYNSTGTTPIEYLISLSDSFSIITSHSGGETGTTTTTEVFTVSSGTAGWTATITFTATSPTGVQNSPFFITVTLI